MPDDPQIDSLKLPPHSLEAEQSVLGGLLLDNEAVDKVGDVLIDADFYSEAHRLVYAHIVRLVADGKPADVVTVSESLASVQKLDYIGGLAYLGALVGNVPTAANIRHYAQIVRDRSILRQLAGTAGDIADSAYNPLGHSAKEILDQAEARILHIAEQGDRGAQQFAEIGKLLAEVVERIETLYNRDDPSAVTGVPTGFTDLDEKTSGLQPGDLVIIAGRPSMGKTALALNIAEHVALEHEDAGRDILDGNGRVAARAADDRLGRPAGPAQAAHRAARGGGLGKAVGGARAPVGGADPDRRDAGAERDRSPLARPAAREDLRQARPRHRRLPAADAGVDAGRESRDRDLRDLAGDEVAREGAQGARWSRCRSSTARSSSGRTSGR